MRFEVTIGDGRVVYRPEQPSGVGVVLCHALKGRHTQWVARSISPHSVAVAEALATAGITCVGSDLAGDAWGNDRAVEAFADDVQRLGCETVGAYCTSMGHCVPIRYKDGLAAVYGVAPVCDVNRVWLDKRVPAWASVGEAWGVVWPEPVPFDAARDVAPGPRWHLDYGTLDRVCPPDTVEAFAAVVGATVAASELPHGQSLFEATDPRKVVEFFTDASRRT